MSTALVWRDQITALSHKREIVVPEAHQARPTIRRMAETILKDFSGEADIVGWSMGAYIALEMARLAPDRMASLTLLNASARPESDASRSARAEAAEAIAQHGLLRVFTERFNSVLHKPERVDPLFKRRLIAESVRLGERTLRSQIGAMINRADMRTAIRAISAPTLVVTGARDRVAPPDCSEEIAAAIPGAILQILPDVGHCAPIEAPDEINRLIETFLDR
jgi:pimeloyl-ACP methyl ester carboxylesterase